MKRLILAIAAAATTLFAPAAIKTQLDFESNGTAYESAADKPSATANYPFAGFGDKYLALDDGYEASGVFGENDLRVFDMYVQFTVHEDPSLGENDKLGICLKSNGNLIVLGEEEDELSLESQIAENTWHRLTLVQVQKNDKYGFNIYLDGNPLVGVLDKDVFYAKVNEASTSVKFEGSGKLDNFVARTTDPFYSGACAASVGTGADNEKYATYSAALADVLSSGATQAITIAGETPKTVDGTAANPYEITNLADLKAFQAAIAATNGVDKCYTLTADIALGAPWDGIGLKNGKDVVATTDFDNAAFCGTFDGQNHTISGFQMVGVAGNPANEGKEPSQWEGLDYCGFFNSTYGATIKNLKIQYAGSLFAADTTSSTKESGATFVGVAKNSTLQNLTSLAGTVSCSKGFGGIVGYTTSGTTVDSCTNNVNMTSLANNKCGGIAMITQSGSAVTISNCQNNGTQTTGSSNSEYGAIVGYVGLNTTIANCETTVGRFLKHQNNTVTLQGVNKGDARVASYHGAATPGLNFAMVDGNVATFVADDALVLDGSVEYKVMGPSAAYTFAAAGTLALDQSLAAATVTADTSKFVFTTSEPVDNVTTYTAVAGVASVDGQAYATLAEAVDNYQDGDVIEFLSAPASGDLAVLKGDGTTIKFKLDTNYVATFYALRAASGYSSSQMYFLPDADHAEYVAFDVSEIAQVAQLTHDGQSTWYSTVEAAYGNAASGDSLLINLEDNFSVAGTTWASGDKALDTITFVNTTESALTVDTYTTPGSGVYYYLKAANWVAPANVTLKLYTQTVTSINAGTLEVPAGVKLTLPNFANNITVNLLKGAGRLSCAGRANNTFSPCLRDASNWTGTMEMTGFDYLGGDIALKLWGNENSTVCFSDVNLKFVNTYNTQNGVKALEIGPGGLGLKGAYDSACTIVIPAKVTGTGKLTFAQTGSALCTYNFTGDFSEFAGSMTIGSGAQNRVYIGTNCSGDGACISIANGATATVAAGQTWDSQNGFVVLGTLNVAGTLKHNGGSAAGKIYGAATTGKIVYKNAAAITTFGGSYKGEIVIDSIEAGNTTTQVALGFGCSEAKLTLNGVSGDAWCAGADYTVQPEVTLAGNVHFQNGSSGKTVTFRKIAAGTGNLSLRDWNGCSGITYGFTTLDADNYTGTVVLYGSKLTFKVGNILKTGAVAGDKVLPLTVESNATVDLSNATLNGETADLELKADGIYVALPPAPKVAEIVGGEQFETLAGAIAAATDGVTVKLLADADGAVGVNANDITLDLAGFTVTGGDAIKWTGSGKLTIVDSVGGGKAIATAEDGCAIWVTGGTVEVQAGYFQNSSEEEATVYVGVAGASAIITGGIFKNTVQDYKWAGSDFDYYCLNVGNSLSATAIQVSGGSFSHDPAKGDDKLGSLLAEGYETSYDSQTGYYVVSKSAGGFPGGADGKTFTIDDAVQTALEAKLPAGKALTDTVEGTTSGLTYAQAYALDLFDEDTGTVEDVKPTIEIVNGKVVVSLDATAKAGYKVMLNVYEKSSLTAQWPTEPTKSYELDSAAEAAGFAPSAAGAGFYKVGVTIEDAE